MEALSIYIVSDDFSRGKGMKNLRVASILVAVCVMLAPHAGLADPVTYRWMGSMSCGAWPRDKPHDSTEVAVPLNWALGFLSARAGSRELDLLRRVDIPSVKLWIDNYCAGHPLDDLPTAVMALDVELAARARSLLPSPNSARR